MWRPAFALVMPLLGGCWMVKDPALEDMAVRIRQLETEVAQLQEAPVEASSGPAVQGNRMTKRGCSVVIRGE